VLLFTGLRIAELVALRRAHLVEDSLDLGTCEGAGTIGLELLERGSQLDMLVIALGGGALASGVGHVARAVAPGVEVVAVQHGSAGDGAIVAAWLGRGDRHHRDHR